MQLHASHTHFSDNEMIRVQYILPDLYQVLFQNRNENSTSSLEFKLTLLQLKRLHMMIGLMIPEKKNED